jgi:hypothetical protein
MSEEIPKGSVGAGTRLKLPPGAEPPINVYINGVRQQQGQDYRVDRGHVVFPRQIVKEQVSGGRWLAMFLGLFGSYGKNEVVDVEYRRGDRTELVSDAKMLP